MSCPRNTDTAVENWSAKPQEKQPLLYLNGKPRGKSLVLSLIIRGSQVKADIIKLDIFSEPSHTHLLSVRSIDYPKLVFDVMDAFAFSAPAATVTTGMKLAGPRVSVPMPPDTDERIRVEAIFNEGKSYYSKTLADIKLGSISEPFAFSVSEDVSLRVSGKW
ncbi:MAG: hypothetical protein D6806_05065 [Deltaproteobacteria bacterium]|nr:MAG: hypothetical protein D6806_05065 [Deltaproteobacteria bacterium]